MKKNKRINAYKQTIIDNAEGTMKASDGTLYAVRRVPPRQFCTTAKQAAKEKYIRFQVVRL